MHFKKQNLKSAQTRGFSLLEVLVTAAIIGLITAIVLVKYGAFNSTVLLKNHAYRVALSLREAQVFSVSIRSDTNLFRDKYGMYIDMGAGPTTELIMFLDTYPATGNSEYDNGNDVIVDTLVLDSRFEISELCVNTSIQYCKNNTDSDFDSLSITFGRPDFDAHFEVDTLISSIQSASIKLTSVGEGAISQMITVGSTGQISVQTQTD